jgi:hypothetical protein
MEYANLTSGETLIHMFGKARSNYNQGYIGYTHSSDGSSSNRITFGFFNYDYLVNILGNGNVGIGTTAPSHKLTVTSGNIAVESGNLYLASSYPLYFDYGISNSYSILKSSTALTFNTAGSFVFSGGNIGIGTTAPDQLLRLNGTAGQPGTTSTTQNGIIRMVGWTTGSVSGYGETLDMGFHVGLSGPPSYAWLQATNWSGLNINYNLNLNPNGGNVGVGTTTPTARLHVSGTAGGVFEVDGASAVTALYVSASGNVGIGTASPLQTLHVYKNASGPTAIIENAFSTGYSSISFYGASSSAKGHIGYGNASTSVWANQFFLGSITSIPVVISVGDSAKMFIDTNGNVGIGTTSPLNKLHVVGTSRFTDEAYFTDKLGVGTVSLTYKAEVAGAIGEYWNGSAFTGTPLALAISNTTAGGYDPVLLYRQADSGGTIKLAGGIGLVGTGPWTAGNNGSQTSDMYFLVRNDSGGITERMRIKSNGNVGVGTTAPNFTAANRTTLDINGVTSAGLGLSAGGTLYGYAYANSGVAIFGSYGNYNLELQTNATTKLTITGGGSVGIGTTAPSQSLHVVGNVYVDDDNTTGGGIILGTGDRPLITRGWDPFTSGTKNGIGRWGIYMESAELFLGCPGTDYVNGLVTIGGWLLDGTRQPNLTVNNYTRNVGIGTTSPAYKLDVTGIGRFTGDSAEVLRLHKTSGGSSQIVMTTSFGNSFGISPFIAGVSNGGFSITDITNNVQRIVIQDSTGNVGIGTTSPGGNLDVQGSSTTNVSYFRTSGSANRYIFNVQNIQNGAQVDFRVHGSSYSETLFGNSMTNASAILGQPSASAVFAIGNYNNGPLVLGTNNSERLRILGDGNVGVGVTAPAFPLDVNGPGRFVSNGASRVLYLVQDQTNAGNIIQFRNQSNTDIGEIVYRNNQFYIYSNAISGYIMYANPATGNVGIKTSSVSYALDVSGDIRATADIIAYSDARVKENINTITDALTKVTSLRGVTYTRKDTEDKSEKVGVIAQEVLEILPQVVQQDDNGNYSVAYGNMAGVFIEAIKELKSQNDALLARIEQLENK